MGKVTGFLEIEREQPTRRKVEERLPAAYEEIPALAQSTVDACRAWAEANTRLTTLQKG